MEKSPFEGLDPIGLESPFADRGEAELERERIPADLLEDSPFVPVSPDRAPAPERVVGEARRVEEGEAGVGGEAIEHEAGGWTGSPEQVDFRDRVLAAHLARHRKQHGGPFPDLTPDQERSLRTIAGTRKKALPATADAAERLLAAANKALVQAQADGDEDALRTNRISITSAYRSTAEQRSLWINYFETKYYGESRAARERLPGGPHSDAAVHYMLEPKPKGFGLAGRIAAPGYSNHQNGIAVDFWQNRRKGHEIQNSTSGKWPDAWRHTWFFNWLQKNHRTYHFEPYDVEPWHWELRDPGTARKVAHEDREATYEDREAASAAASPAGSLWAYQSQVSGTRVALYVPPAASRRAEVDLLLYVHGLLSPCGAVADAPIGFISGGRFRLGNIIDSSGIPAVLVVPLFQMGGDRSWSTGGLDQPAKLNAFIAEAFAEIGRNLGKGTPELDRLILCGHSRAFGILYPVAQKHRDPEQSAGALAKLARLWLLDATYGSPPMQEFRALERVHPGLRVDVVYRAKSRTDKFGGRSSKGALRLRPIRASINHCDVPVTILPGLLAELEGAGNVREPTEADREQWLMAPVTTTEWTEGGLAETRAEASAYSEDYQMLGIEPGETAPGQSAEQLEDETEALETEAAPEGEELAWLDYEARQLTDPAGERLVPDRYGEQEASFFGSPGSEARSDALGLEQSEMEAFDEAGEDYPDEEEFAANDFAAEPEALVPESTSRPWSVATSGSAFGQLVTINCNGPGALHLHFGAALSGRPFAELRNAQGEGAFEPEADLYSEQETGDFELQVPALPSPADPLKDYRITPGHYRPDEKRFHATHRAGIIRTSTRIGPQEQALMRRGPSPISIGKTLSRFEDGRVGNFVAHFNEFTYYFDEVLRAIGRLRDLLSAGCPEVPKLMTALQKLALRPTDDRSASGEKKRTFHAWRKAQQDYARTTEDGRLVGGSIVEVATLARNVTEARNDFWDAQAKLTRALAIKLDKPEYELANPKIADIAEIVLAETVEAAVTAGLTLGADLLVEAIKNRKEYDTKMQRFLDALKAKKQLVEDELDAYRAKGQAYWDCVGRHINALKERTVVREQERQSAGDFGQALAPRSVSSGAKLAEIRMPVLVADAWRALALNGEQAVKRLAIIIENRELVARARLFFERATPDPWEVNDITRLYAAYTGSISWRAVLDPDQVKIWSASHAAWEELFRKFDV